MGENRLSGGRRLSTRCDRIASREQVGGGDAALDALLTTHLIALFAGFVLGIYALPILTAPPGPDKAALRATQASAVFKGHFDRNLEGSDLVHWGEGEVRFQSDKIAHEGRLSPGPDYKLFLLRSSLTPKQAFSELKSGPDASATSTRLMAFFCQCRRALMSAHTRQSSCGVRHSASSSARQSTVERDILSFIPCR